MVTTEEVKELLGKDSNLMDIVCKAISEGLNNNALKSKNASRKRFRRKSNVIAQPNLFDGVDTIKRASHNSVVKNRNKGANYICLYKSRNNYLLRAFKEFVEAYLSKSKFNHVEIFEDKSGCIIMQFTEGIKNISLNQRRCDHRSKDDFNMVATHFGVYYRGGETINERILVEKTFVDEKMIQFQLVKLSNKK